MLDILSLEEVALQLEISENETKNLFKRGEIIGKYVGNNWVTTPDKLKLYIKKRDRAEGKQFQKNLCSKLESIERNIGKKEEKVNSSKRGYISLEEASKKYQISRRIIERIAQISWVTKRVNNRGEPEYHYNTLDKAIKELSKDSVFLAELTEMQTTHLRDMIDRISKKERFCPKMREALGILKAHASHAGINDGVLISQAVDWYISENRIGLDKASALDYINITDPDGFLSVVRARMDYL